MLIIRGVIVVSMKEDSDAWIIASSGSVDKKEHIARVRAQVMFWDDSTGLWGISSGGGISNICLFKVISHMPSADDVTESYRIQAHRISDKNMLLDCQVTRELEYTNYNNSMLHHWCVAGRKYGLTFQSPSEASLFYEAIGKVLQLLKNCASQNVTTVSKWSDLPTKASIAKAQPVHLKKISDIDSKEKLLISRDFSYQGAEGPYGLPFIPEEDQELIPPPKIISSVTYGAVKKPRAKTPPASPSQLLERHHPYMEARSSSFRFQERCPLNQWGSFQSTSQAVTNEYIPSPHRITLNNYNPISRDILLSAQQALAEKEALVVEEDLGRSLIRRNSFQSISESYVHLTKNDPYGKHDYSYPTLYSVQNQSVAFGRSHSNPRISSVVAPPVLERISARETAPSSSGMSIPLPVKSSVRQQRTRASMTTRRSQSSSQVCTLGSLPKVRCLYCQEHFTSEEMSRGICKDAPDKMLKCIKTTTCFCCVEAARYHCMADCEDDDFEEVAMERSSILCSRNCKRSVVFAFVCMFVPCLWCYPVLRACHRCAVRVGWTGPRHRRV